MAINPPEGSTYLDAEHVVILMQENRSFDHCFGTLRGVRGFNDPRAITLPDKNLVWMQTNDAGETYLPFRFDIRNTKATWMGSVPHSRSSQVDANNQGKYDRWLQSKRVRNKKFAEMPLTLGYYTREDIPFYYAMADAFTVCDQNFCSAMTSTRPNRLFFWTGTIRPEQNGDAKAYIRNEDESFGTEHWMTFPERLEENGISWKFYQNDIDCGGGFDRGQRAWLANFGCNPLEWFANFNVKFSPRYIQSLQKQTVDLPAEIKALQDKLRSLSATDQAFGKIQTAIRKKQEVLDKARQELVQWSRENYDKLSRKEKNLYENAFSTNAGDPDYHSLTTLNYEENGEKRQLDVPKGDVLYQFRKDVESGKLPTVSWLAGAQNFSDHPSAPWYGSLYLSEILDILTKNPEVWKKTIFIVTFDENDGYFDHVPPFVAPDPDNPASGKCSPGLDTRVEYIRRASELSRGVAKNEAREGPVGLGFRVPLLIASPWSRGGKVCSQVFDHTSTLQFLEDFLGRKLGKPVRETNISAWRRAITGDLSSVFKADKDRGREQLPFLEKDPFYEKIYNAKFKKTPNDFRPLSKEEIDGINNSPSASALMPRQEKGVRPACALPYQLYVSGQLGEGGKRFELTMEARDEFFGKRSAGSPFNVYFPGKYNTGKGVFENTGSRSYAVSAGDRLTDSWEVAAFENGIYHVRVYGPNGFFREFSGRQEDPQIRIACEYERRKNADSKPSGNLVLQVTNLHPSRSYEVVITDHGYKTGNLRKSLAAGGGGALLLPLNLEKSFGWYDFSLRVPGFDEFERRFAGHVETGEDSYTDPAMGNA
ncbi:phospholipase C, phosphocholine-specific [Compostibacter hankyongensis]|uniref:Phospholipase C, phosphocholine-specific n=2 Tax=Compostibacter hankyongensis TaxID=1007089 RepID=A0ABP8G7T9_9BACT